MERRDRAFSEARTAEGHESSAPPPAASPIGAALRFRREAEALRAIDAEMNRIESEFTQLWTACRAVERGYFTPDEDDSLRRLWVAYRDLRLAVYDISYAHRAALDMDEIEAEARDRSFLIGYVGALIVYARALRLVNLVEARPMLRDKLNEPDRKFALGAHGYEAILRAFTSTVSLRLLWSADLFWRRHHRRLRRAARERQDEAWAVTKIVQLRRELPRSLVAVLARRVRVRAAALARQAWARFNELRLQLRTFLAIHLSRLRLSPGRPAIDGAALAEIASVLRPGDILALRTEGKLTTALLPGFWAHAVIFAGDRARLAPLLAPGRDFLARAAARLPESDPLGHIVEGVAPEATLTPLADALKVDHVAVLRPVAAEADRAAALDEAFGHLGKAYDFSFDFNQTNRIVCTELVWRAWHGRSALEFDLVRRVGRYNMTCDDLVHLALDGIDSQPAAPVEIVGVWLSERNGSVRRVAEGRDTLIRLREGWRPR